MKLRSKKLKEQLQEDFRYKLNLPRKQKIFEKRATVIASNIDYSKIEKTFIEWDTSEILNLGKEKLLGVFKQIQKEIKNRNFNEVLCCLIKVNYFFNTLPKANMTQRGWQITDYSRAKEIEGKLGNIIDEILKFLSAIFLQDLLVCKIISEFLSIVHHFENYDTKNLEKYFDSCLALLSDEIPNDLIYSLILFVYTQLQKVYYYDEKKKKTENENFNYYTRNKLAGLPATIYMNIYHNYEKGKIKQGDFNEILFWIVDCYLENSKVYSKEGASSEAIDLALFYFEKYQPREKITFRILVNFYISQHNNLNVIQFETFFRLVYKSGVFSHFIYELFSLNSRPLKDTKSDVSISSLFSKKRHLIYKTTKRANLL